jgi:heme/copper-type cytochrome/quinol oxidase subunit 2
MTTTTPSTGEQPTQAPAPEAQSHWSIQRVAILSAGVLGGIIVLIFLIGLVLALLDNVDATAARIEILKNTMIIIMILEALLIVAALAILIVQVGRLINLLQNKAKPVLENTQEAVNSAKGTIEFVGENVTEPIIQVGSFMAGARVFIREVGGIRRAIRKDGKGEPDGTE